MGYNEPDNLICRSRCYFKMGKPLKAMEDVDMALTLDLGHPAVSIRLEMGAFID